MQQHLGLQQDVHTPPGARPSHVGGQERPARPGPHRGLRCPEEAHLRGTAPAGTHGAGSQGAHQAAGAWSKGEL